MFIALSKGFVVCCSFFQQAKSCKRKRILYKDGAISKLVWMQLLSFKPLEAINLLAIAFYEMLSMIYFTDNVVPWSKIKMKYQNSSMNHLRFFQTIKVEFYCRPHTSRPHFLVKLEISNRGLSNLGFFDVDWKTF